MEPRIQYAKTSDGVNIAYAVLGVGPPIVYMGGGFGNINVHAAAARSIGQPADTLVELGWRVILYDGRGSGSSDRSDPDFSLEARMLDLDAVIQRTGIERFALWGTAQGGPVAVAYAVEHPDGVSGLVLASTFARGADWYGVNPTLRATRALGVMAEEDWEYFTLALANALTGFNDSDRASKMAATFREGMSASAFLAYREAGENIDVTGLLPLVNVPTLVLHTPVNRLSNVALMRELASRIPNARLVTADDGALEIDAFLREAKIGVGSEPVDLSSGTAVILFADIVDSTALTESLGDAAFRTKARELAASLRALIRECSGTSVEGPTLGDGVLAVFTSAREAIDAAQRCAKAGDDAGLPLHLGLHAGDVSREKDPDGRDNVYGGAVNIAARISGLSAPGEVLVSETVRSLARTSAGVAFEDRGEQALKGVGEAMRVWAVVEGE